MKRLLAVVLLSFAACGSTFSYKWYGLSLPHYDHGSLLDEKPEGDLPISVCEPDEVGAGKCVVILTDEFERMKADLEVLKVQLEDCQKRCTLN